MYVVTYRHSTSMSDFFERNDKPENSENFESFSVHTTNSSYAHSSIFTNLHRAGRKSNDILGNL